MRAYRHSHYFADGHWGFRDTSPMAATITPGRAILLALRAMPYFHLFPALPPRRKSVEGQRSIGRDFITTTMRNEMQNAIYYSTGFCQPHAAAFTAISMRSTPLFLAHLKGAADAHTLTGAYGML